MSENLGIPSNRKLNFKVGKLELFKEGYFKFAKQNNINNNNDSLKFLKTKF